MDVLYARCCGLDIHKRSVTACLLTPGPDGQPTKTIRTFETMTGDLLALGDWLGQAGGTHVVMERTGVYWKPEWNLFETQFTLLLVNAAHVKVVPGRKRDLGDAEWLATLLRHGLLRGSFVPDRPVRELRELTRYRSSLVRARSAEVDPGRGQHQAGQCRQRHNGGFGAGDAGRPGSRPGRCRDAGRPGP